MNNILKQITPAMTGYLKGLIYRNTRTSCVCLASLSELAHDQFTGFYTPIFYIQDDYGNGLPSGLSERTVIWF